jgi:transcriptional regulator GlxA family with amidase domain
MSEGGGGFLIGIAIYPGVDLMDVAAPREVFSWMAQSWNDEGTVEVLTVAEHWHPVTTRDGTRIGPDATFAQVPAVDLMWVPGGDVDGLKAQMANSAFLDALGAWAEDARWVTSVCEGALLLASAGLLDGYRATTHWAFLNCLREYEGVTVIGGDGDFPRFVVDPEEPDEETGGVRVTGAGISAGIDEALELVKLIAGESVAESVQQTMQYYPDPPVYAELPEPGACPMDG